MQDFPRNICFSVYFCFVFKMTAVDPVHFQIFSVWLHLLTENLSHCRQKPLENISKIDLDHKSQNATVQYPTMLHSEQTFAYFRSEWDIEQMHSGICVCVAPHMEWTLHFDSEYSNLTQGGTALFQRIRICELTVAAILDLSIWGIFCKHQLVFPSSILRLHYLLYTGDRHWKYPFGFVMCLRNWIFFVITVHSSW